MYTITLQEDQLTTQPVLQHPKETKKTTLLCARPNTLKEIYFQKIKELVTVCSKPNMAYAMAKTMKPFYKRNLEIM